VFIATFGMHGCDLNGRREESRRGTQECVRHGWSGNAARLRSQRHGAGFLQGAHGVLRWHVFHGHEIFEACFANGAEDVRVVDSPVPGSWRPGTSPT